MPLLARRAVAALALALAVLGPSAQCRFATGGGTLSPDNDELVAALGEGSPLRKAASLLQGRDRAACAAAFGQAGKLLSARPNFEDGHAAAEFFKQAVRQRGCRLFESTEGPGRSASPDEERTAVNGSTVEPLTGHDGDRPAPGPAPALRRDAVTRAVLRVSGGQEARAAASLRGARVDDGMSPLSPDTWTRRSRRWTAALYKRHSVTAQDLLHGFGPAKPLGVAGQCRNVWVSVSPQDQNVVGQWDTHLPDLIQAIRARIGLRPPSESLEMDGDEADQAAALKTHWAYLCGRVVRQGAVLGVPDPGAAYRVPRDPAVLARLRLALKVLQQACEMEGATGRTLYRFAFAQTCNVRLWQ
ncbi:hypothetical protein FNF29_06459 [Cafeteria roenbergensis]|uniref:Uncharacterized protein n=2 Tax=Cafeteria roenbergensis TaxID=33653 RepID=A0A5A8C8C0_CAFRO|nr:hypothetical protein FNF29_06459 [Cafeteria roenbergensis]|eukprot:KAA0148834.1 hypothetical protein FNF29_06459 [Cafeteria roenbergensis]